MMDQNNHTNHSDMGSLPISTKLWIYTNYDCNLRCDYCVAESSPRAPRRAMGLENTCRLVDEALELGFCEVLFTGGEPFILDEIYEMLAYAWLQWNRQFETIL